MRINSQLFYGVSLLRSSLFTTEFLLIPLAEMVALKRLPQVPTSNVKLLARVRTALRGLLRADAARIAAGVYPPSVLFASEPTKDPVGHLQRLPRIFKEVQASVKRRAGKQTKVFSAAAERHLAGLPSYYRRNFHFQPDGYLGEESAALYDHQVEVLFLGGADAMRRMLIAPLKRHFGAKDGRGLRILEVGCGSGSATNFLRLAFPLARITAVDLSVPYLEVAKARVPSAQFLPAAGEDLPFGDGEFDAVVSVFLFHELPQAVREQVLKESRRVLKGTGIFAYVDSLQLSDEPIFDDFLHNFPITFHEPFYANYAKVPMEGLLAKAGFRPESHEVGFFAKMQAALPATARARPRPKRKPIKNSARPISATRSQSKAEARNAKR